MTDNICGKWRLWYLGAHISHAVRDKGNPPRLIWGNPSVQTTHQTSEQLPFVGWLGGSLPFVSSWRPDCCCNPANYWLLTSNDYDSHVCWFFIRSGQCFNVSTRFCFAAILRTLTWIFWSLLDAKQVEEIWICWEMTLTHFLRLRRGARYSLF